MLSAVGNYFEALELYEKIQKPDKETIFNRGVARYHANKLDLCLEDMKLAFDKEIKNPSLFYYTALSYFAKADYTNAIIHFKNFLRNTTAENTLRASALEHLRRAEFASRVKYLDQMAFVENLGTVVNTIYDEIKPLPSPTNPNKHYFSSNRDLATGGQRNAEGLKDDFLGKYAHDMFAIEQKDGVWTMLFPFSSLQNTSKQEWLLDFSKDAGTMYFLRGTDLTNAQLMVDTFRNVGENPQLPQPLTNLPFDPSKGDRDLHFIDAKTILFASNRLGGFGGYDLFVVKQDDTGQWPNPTNLGARINTAADEVSPNLTNGGMVLYFSSNRLEGMGGFDIFMSVYDYDNQYFDLAQNMGTPINSPMDDIDFHLSLDGTQAFFSSNRKEGIGGFDLYMAFLKNQVIDQLMYTEQVFLLENPGRSQDVARESSNNKVPKKEFVSKSIYYRNDQEILSPANVSQLVQLIDILRIFPDLKVQIIGHTSSETLKEFNLYFSMKRAEKVYDYLVERGIPADRISVTGVGSSFPAEKSILGANMDQRNTNNRIDFRFINPNENLLNIVIDRPNVPESIQDSSFLRLDDRMEKLSYRIKIAESSQILKNDLVKEASEAFIEKLPDGNYAYFVGLFDQYNQARQMKNEFLRRQFIDVKIMAYQGIEPLNASRIKTMTSQYPDLENYLKFEQP